MPFACPSRVSHDVSLQCRVHHAADAQPAAKRRKTAKLPAAIVLDIEGTVAPISFVTEVRCTDHRALRRLHPWRTRMCFICASYVRTRMCFIVLQCVLHRV